MHTVQLFRGFTLLLSIIVLFSLVLIVSEPMVSGSASHTTAEPPVAAESAQPFLTVGKNGEFLMSWIEPGRTTRHAFRYATFDGSTWSEPITIAEGNDFFVNWADVPSIFQATSVTMMAHWLRKSGAGTYAYDVNIGVSRDNGRSWSSPIIPHSDATQTEHGFVSFFESADGEIGLVWLDGREMAGSMSHDAHAGTGSMTLRAGVLKPDGRTVIETLIDRRVCECCPTAAVRTRKGVVVAYRDRSEKEVRNISIVRYEKGRWTKPFAVNEDGWVIPGCPVNGPALSANDDRVAIAWFTAPEGVAQVNVAFSNNGGTSFGKPIRVDGGSPLGRVAINLFPDGSALVMWLEQRGNDAELRIRLVRPDGKTNAPQVIATMSADRKSGYPRIARSGNRLLVAWVDTKAARIKTRLLSVDELLANGKTSNN